MKTLIYGFIVVLLASTLLTRLFLHQFSELEPDERTVFKIVFTLLSFLYLTVEVLV